MPKAKFINNFIFYLCVVLSCLPLFLMFLLTVSASWVYPNLLPQTISIDFIKHVFINNTVTLKAVITSVVVGISSTLLAIAISIPAAKAMAVYEFRGKKIIAMLILLPLAVPAITVTAGIQINMIRMRLTGTFLGVTLIHTVFMLPYSIRTLTNVFAIIKNNYEDQAYVLGATGSQAFRLVTLPVIMPGILSASLLCFTISLSQYVTTFLIGGGKIITVSMLLIPYIQSGQIQVASVYSLIFILMSVFSLVMIESIVKKYYNLNIAFYG